MKHFKIHRITNYFVVSLRVFGRYYQLFRTNNFLNCLEAIADYCYCTNTYKAVVYDPKGANSKMTIKYDKDIRINYTMYRKPLFVGIEWCNISRQVKFLFWVKAQINNIINNLKF